MTRPLNRIVSRTASLFALCLCIVLPVHGQNAQVAGTVMDSQGAVIPKASVTVLNKEKGISHTVETNSDGAYLVPFLVPAIYSITVKATGFQMVISDNIKLEVGQNARLDFKLQVGTVEQTVTVSGEAPLVNTTDGTVSTVVDRQFAENLPMNGRSFQTLIQLTPGVVVVPSNSSDSGQFTVNGQRAVSNYWTVDGVSANIGVTAGQIPGNGFSGALASFSVLGGTNSLVSVDAMQEFRIQTSTYAPEFGRVPGGQISIVTRSGTNQFHGTLFDYLRNDLLDANDWFANSAGLPKPKERQNDFGGTFSGPILKDRSFFFFSYEGLRLRLPQTQLTTVPDLAARQNATATVRPFLNAYPLPNGTDNLATGVAQFNFSYSNKATLDAYSIRIDHKLNDKLSLFGRYNYSPSEADLRGNGGSSLNTVSPTRTTTQTATIGTTWAISPAATNDLRFNYSRTDASTRNFIDDFGGAVPLASSPFPSPFTDQNAGFDFFILGLQNPVFLIGKTAHNQLQQFNIVNSLSLQKASHNLKFGVDFRRLTPFFDPAQYLQEPLFLNVQRAETGSPLFTVIDSSLRGTLLFNNLGLYAQDTWRVVPRFTLTYGLRWDVEFAASSIEGPSLTSLTGFDLNNLSSLALAPAGTAPYKTRYGNLAPRLGIAYQLRQSQDWQAVLRGGFGVFYDVATSEVGARIASSSYPFGGERRVFGGTFPLSSASAALPAITPPTSNGGALIGIDPRLQSPYTLEWNFALEQALGKQQSLSVSYVGAAGRRLLQTIVVRKPNANLAFGGGTTNAATSDYNALQLQFQRRLSRGLQALASYTWSHSIDTASAGSTAVRSNAFIPSAINANRGSSDFDLRHALSIGFTYDIPSPKLNYAANAILHGWSVENFITAHSAPPVNVSDFKYSFFSGGIRADVRPDLVTGQPFYLFGSQCSAAFQALGTLAAGHSCPGGKGLNPAAFTDPPADSSGTPVRQGTAPRNAFRGFGATQWDFAVHRDFPIHESLKLQFRAEMFNVLNHPNFGQPNGSFGLASFGVSSQMLGQYLNGGVTGQSNAGGGAFNPLYQVGGPRSVQFALKVQF
jgi:hypothetical protein